MFWIQEMRPEEFFPLATFIVFKQIKDFPEQAKEFFNLVFRSQNLGDQLVRLQVENLASRYTRAWVTFIQELPFYSDSVFQHIEKVIERVKDHQAVVQISMIVDGFLTN